MDQLGYLDDAVELAKREAGLPEAKVVTYRRPGGYKHNIYSKMSDDASGVRPLPRFDSVSLISLLHGGTPQFLYLWMP